MAPGRAALVPTASSSSVSRQVVERAPLSAASQSGIYPRGAPWTRRLAPAVYLLPAFAVYTLFVLWPLARLAWLSLERWDGYSAPAFIGFANYAGLWSDPGVALELRHSLIWLGVTLLAPALLGLALALLLAAAPTRLSAVLRALLLVPLLLPTAVIAVAWRLLYSPLAGPLSGFLQAVGLGGWAADWLGDPRLALGALLVPACWASFGLSLLIFGAALLTISPETRDAARVDGAGAWARFRYVTLPHLRGALAFAMVATALCAVPSLDLVVLLTNGGPGYATTTLALDMDGRAFGLGQVGVGATLGCLQAALGLVLSGAALLVMRGQSGPLDGDAVFWRAAARRIGPGRLAAGLGGVVVAALVLFPLAWLVVLSGHVNGWPGVWANLATVWTNGFGAAFLTSLGIAAGVSAVTVALAVPAAFALHRAGSRPLRILGAAALVIGLFQPTAVLIIPLFSLLKQLGLLNSPLGLILPEIARTVPIAVLLLWGAQRGLPADVLAAGAVDGAAPRQLLWRVAVPLTLPMVAVVGLWAFLSSWNEYTLPTIVLQDEGLQTIPLALSHFIGTIDTQYALVATGSLLSIVPILLLYGALYGSVALGLRRLPHGAGRGYA